MRNLRKYAPTITDPYTIRARHNLTQKVFWGMLGVKHNGGHLYEHGREMPRCLEILIGIVFMGKPIPTPPDPRAEERQYANKPVFKRGQYKRKKRPHCYVRAKDKAP